MSFDIEIKNQKSKIIFSGLFLLLALAFPVPSFAATTVDYTSMKDFFKEFKIGEKVNGDLSSDTIPNPYGETGVLKGYKLSIGKDADPKKLEASVQSCAFQLAMICAGDSFSEVVYVLNSKFQPVEGEYRQKEKVDFTKFKLPEDRVLYLLVGSEKATPAGQYTVSITSK